MSVGFAPEVGATVDIVAEAEAILHTEAARLRREAHAARFGGLALRAAEMALPEDLCDTSVVYGQYEKFVGSIQPHSESEFVKPEADKRDSLYNMLHGAARGSTEARAGVEANAESVVIEDICKDGSILTVDAEMSDDAQIVQSGQKTRDRQRKTMEWYPDQSPLLGANTFTEGRNVSVIEHLWKLGKLEGKKVLEVSLIPPASRQELFDSNYFLDRMTAVLRLTSISSKGKVRIESGLVGGVDQDELPAYKADESLEDEMARYDAALELRFDDDVAGEMLEILGVKDAKLLTTTEKLGALVILPEDVDTMDIIQLYDQIVTAKLGKPVFYGLRSLWRVHCNGRIPTRADYEAQRDRSLAQQAELKQTSKRVAHETILRRGQARNDLQAIRLLAQVAKDQVTRYVVEHPSVEARMIVGREAAFWAAKGQERYALNDIDGAEQFIAKAQPLTRTTGCPTGGQRKDQESKSDSKQNDKEPSSKKNQSKKGGREMMRCVTCPFNSCPSKKTDTKVDASVEYHLARGKKRITCCTCHGFKEYDL